MKTRAAKRTPKKSAGKKAPVKKSTSKKAPRSKTAARKTAAKKKSARKTTARKATARKATVEKATEKAVPAPEPGANDTNGESTVHRAAGPQAEPATENPGPPTWGDLMHRVIDVVDPSALRETPERPRPLDERPIGRWIAASFLGGCLFGWVLAAVL